MNHEQSALDFEAKRQVLDMLGIKVWLDGEHIEITGVIPTEGDVIVIMIMPSLESLPSLFGKGRRIKGEGLLKALNLVGLNNP